MDDENNDFVAFPGIAPKPPQCPNLAHLFMHSLDYGSWRDPNEPEPNKKKKKKGGRKRGKIRLYPDE